MRIFAYRQIVPRSKTRNHYWTFHCPSCSNSPDKRDLPAKPVSLEIAVYGCATSITSRRAMGMTSARWNLTAHKFWKPELQAITRKSGNDYPTAKVQTYAFQFEEENSAYPTYKPQSGVLVVSGDYFIFARDRVIALPQSLSLETLLNEKEYTQPQLIELLDFEVSFGRIANGNIPWEIQLSTLPFREGDPLITALTWAAITEATGEYIQHDKSWNGTLTRRWLPAQEQSPYHHYSTGD